MNPLERAFSLHQAGDVDAAAELYRQVLEEHPEQPDALYLLGIIHHARGDNAGAVGLIQRSLASFPNNPTAHDNLGGIYQLMGRAEEAIACHRKAIELDPNCAPAYSNLGNAFQKLGELDEAEAACRRSLEINPGNAGGWVTLSETLRKQGKLDEAESACRKALEIHPGFAEAYNQLGLVLHGLGRFDETVSAYRRAIEINPGYAAVHNSLGTVLFDLGQIEAAIESYERALTLTPGSGDVYNNLGFALATLHGTEGFERGAAWACVERLKAKDPRSPQPYFLGLLLDSLTPDRALDSYRKAAEKLPGIEAETLALGGAGGGASPAAKPRLPERMCALLHFGRSGSGFLHSLIDGHPQVSTLPGAYLNSFFGPGVWSRIAAGGPEEIIDRFSSLYEVLFDAHSSKGLPGNPPAIHQRLGEAEGYTTMGEDRATPLRLDREAFGRNLSALMRGFARLHQGDFFRLAHAAFEATLGRPPDQELIFYHIHNPDDYEFANFLKYFPDAKLLLIVREPLQSCESWVSKDFHHPESYLRLAQRVMNMLFQHDRVAFRLGDSAGVRLEDLKNEPDRTLKALCAWLGIEEADTLRTATMQGLKWWGEPGTPLYGQADQFGKASIRHGSRGVFSEKDRFILETLYYPFRRLFGYADEDQERFERDLEAIRPMLDEPFDFERKYFENLSLPYRETKLQGIGAHLRVALHARWRTLRQHGTYPGMISPLVMG